MKEGLIWLWLVTYPACGEAIYEKVSGPFKDAVVCEQFSDSTTKRAGPPKPGQRYVCAEKAPSVHYRPAPYPPTPH